MVEDFSSPLTWIISSPQLSTYTLDYPYTTAPLEPREKDAFGLETAGRLMLVPMERFEELVKMLEEVYGDVPGAR